MRLEDLLQFVLDGVTSIEGDFGDSHVAEFVPAHCQGRVCKGQKNACSQGSHVPIHGRILSKRVAAGQAPSFGSSGPLKMTDYAPPFNTLFQQAENLMANWG
jgi:hypothetical protein